MKPFAFAVLFFFTHESDVSQLLKKVLCLKQKKNEYQINKKESNSEKNDILTPCIREPLMYSNQAIALARGLERCNMIIRHVHPDKRDGE
jgi:hypothetical protein